MQASISEPDISSNRAKLRMEAYDPTPNKGRGMPSPGPKKNA